MPETIRNLAPVVGSLISKLKDQGLTVEAVDNGGGWQTVATFKAAVAEATAADDARLKVSDGGGRYAHLLLVLDCEPEEILADWSVTKGAADLDAKVEAAAEAFSLRWEGKACPTCSRRQFEKVQQLLSSLL